MKDLYNGTLEMEIEEGGGSSEASDHRLLFHREDAGAHPIGAIEGLTEQLEQILHDISQLAQSSEEIRTLAEQAEQILAVMQATADRAERVSSFALRGALEARDQASDSASDAELSASSASTSADSAANSAQLAHASEQNAETSESNAAASAEGANTAKTAAETAKAQAESAKTAAETAKAQAESAKTAAQTAKTAAESARDAAEQHAEDIEDLTVSVRTLPTGSEASVEKSGGGSVPYNLNFGLPRGGKGDTGNGIASIQKTSTVGKVDTYTITFTNGTTSTFTVTNGADAIYDALGLSIVDGKLCVTYEE